MGRKQAEYNIHNYVQNSTEGFDTKPFNEIDGLIMTQYVQFLRTNIEQGYFDTETQNIGLADAFK